MSTGSEDVDRISDLPEPIISAILSLLPTKSAVATRVLAKSWRFRWTGITALDFSDEPWPDLERTEPETNGDAVPPMDFVEFVNLVVTNHTGPIHKLRLQWESKNIRSVYLSLWLNSAIARNFRVLDLCTVYEGFTGEEPEDYGFILDLPDALYTSGTLETVKLRGQIRIKVPYLVHLPKLAFLELCFVVFECDESLEKLVSACPLLESLKTESHYPGPKQFKVSSPSLKHFEFVYLEYFSVMKLVIDTPSLEHVVINTCQGVKITCSQVMPMNEVDIHTGSGDYPGVVRLIQACGGAKVMRLDRGAIEDLYYYDIPLPDFRRLTKLVVQFYCQYWSNMWDLIDHCNNLQVLDITPVDFPGPDDCLSLPLHIPGCLSSSLKHVYFWNCYGKEVDTRMLKFLLKHGLHIERVTISIPFCGFNSIDTLIRKPFQDEVSMLSRASATCKISFC